MCCQCLRLFCGTCKGVVWKKMKAKQLLSPAQKAECAGTVVLASASHRGICSEHTPAESAHGVAYGEVDVPTNGHTECVAT